MPQPQHILWAWPLAVVIALLLALVILLAVRHARDRERSLQHRDLAMLRIIRDNASLILSEHQGHGKVIPINGGGKREG